MRAEDNTDAMASFPIRPGCAEQVKAVEGEIRSFQFGKPRFSGFSTAPSWRTSAPGSRSSSALFLRSIAFARHFSFAVANDQKSSHPSLFRGKKRHANRELEFHVRGEIAFAVARFS